MKKILYVGLLFWMSCSDKGDVLPPAPDPVTPTLSLKADTALYDGSATVYITTNCQIVKTGTTAVSDGKITFSGLRKDTLVIFTATLSNENGSQSKTESIMIKVFSKNSTQLQSYGKLRNVWDKGCIAGTENSPSAVWYDGILTCDEYVFFANKTGQVIWGPCNTFHVPGTIMTGTWNWSDNTEQAINFGANDIWNIILHENGFDRTQVKNGFYSIQKFRKS